MPSTHGHCSCGRLRFSFDPAGVTHRVHCHCESCRRAASAPFVSIFGVRNSAWRWTGSAPELFRASPQVRRYFCPDCGTPMAFTSARHAETTIFFAASLDDPEDFVPEAHWHIGEKLPWIALADDLPEHADGHGDKTD